MWEQVDDVRCRMAMDADENVREVVDGVDVVLLAGGDERVENGEVVAGFLAGDEEVVLATEGDATKAGLGDVVVGRDGGVSKEAAELADVAEDVSNCPAERAARLERAAMMSRPANEQSEERT